MTRCDHEFADTKHCIKCGWVPPRCRGDGHAILIREWGDSKAALLLADKCREKDATIKKLRDALEEADA